MGISRKQKQKIEKICQCGCNEIFYPFPVYGKKGEGLRYPQYKRGHHPNTKKILKKSAGWNKGLTKETCPTLSKMGYQKGHEPFNDWSEVNKRLKADPEFKKKWLESKKGTIPWNKGKTKADYKNGIKSGTQHGNWCGGTRGVNDTARMKELKKQIRKRDNYTCQHCGDKNHKGRGSRIRLEVHHIVSVSENIHLAFNPSNCITLCHACHVQTDNYGTKLIHRRRQSGN